MQSLTAAGDGGGVTGVPLFIAITGAAAAADVCASACGGPNMASTFERNLSPSEEESERENGEDVRKELDRRREGESG